MSRLLAALLLSFALPIFAAPVVEPYAVILTADRTILDADGNKVSQPAGTVINMIFWDGVAPYDPGPGCANVKCGLMKKTDAAKAGVQKLEIGVSAPTATGKVVNQSK